MTTPLVLPTVALAGLMEATQVLQELGLRIAQLDRLSLQDTGNGPLGVSLDLLTAAVHKAIPFAQLELSLRRLGTHLADRRARNQVLMTAAQTASQDLRELRRKAVDRLLRYASSTESETMLVVGNRRLKVQSWVIEGDAPCVNLRITGHQLFSKGRCSGNVSHLRLPLQPDEDTRRRWGLALRAVSTVDLVARLGAGARNGKASSWVGLVSRLVGAPAVLPTGASSVDAARSHGRVSPPPLQGLSSLDDALAQAAQLIAKVSPDGQSASFATSDFCA